MNIKQELEKMQDEIEEVESKSINLSKRLSLAWWSLFSKIRNIELKED